MVFTAIIGLKLKQKINIINLPVHPVNGVFFVFVPMVQCSFKHLEEEYILFQLRYKQQISDIIHN
jgi:hypothetical protein